MEHFETLEQSIEIDAPPSAVFERWTRFEDFPKFMEGIDWVRLVGPRQLRWHGHFGGETREWSSDITVWIPDHRIAWRATSAGTHSSRAVCIEPAGPGRSRATVRMLIDPDEPWARVPSPDEITRRLLHNLTRFKSLVEISPAVHP